MNYIFGHVMIAKADIDFLPLDLICSVAARGRGRFQRANVAARLRFGQVHRARPFARGQLWQIQRLLRIAAMVENRFN